MGPTCPGMACSVDMATQDKPIVKSNIFTRPWTLSTMNEEGCLYFWIEEGCLLENGCHFSIYGFFITFPGEDVTFGSKGKSLRKDIRGSASLYNKWAGHTGWGTNTLT